MCRVMKKHRFCKLARHTNNLCKFGIRSTIFMMFAKILRHLHDFLNSPRSSLLLMANSYILCVFTESPVIKPLERNVVYIPIITSNHARSMTSK